MASGFSFTGGPPTSCKAETGKRPWVSASISPVFSSVTASTIMSGIFKPGLIGIRQSRGPDRHVDQHAIRIRRIVPQEEFVRLRMKISDLALRRRQARIHVDAIGLHPADRVGAAVPHQDVAILPASMSCTPASAARGRRIPDCLRTIAGISPTCTGGCFSRIRLDLENVDRMPHARAVPMADEDAIAGDAETARVARAIEIAAFFHSPVAGSLTDGTVSTQCSCSKLRNRCSFLQSLAPARASSSDEVGSTLPFG